MRRCRLALWLLVAAWPFGQGAAAGEIRGRFATPEERPLPGALVTLYAAPTDLLVGLTYSRDDGRFTLAGPPDAGSFYVIATQQERAARSQVFAYDPERPTPEVLLEDRGPGSFWFARAAPELLDYGVNALIGSVIGLTVGLGFKIAEDLKRQRKSRARYLGELRLWAARLGREREQIEELLALSPAPGDLLGRLAARSERIRDDADELARLLTPATYAEETGHWRVFGSASSAGQFQALAVLLSQIKSLRSERLLTASSEERAVLLAPIARLPGELERFLLLRS